MATEKRDWHPGKRRFKKAVTVVIARRVPEDKVQDFKDKVQAIIKEYQENETV